VAAQAAVSRLAAWASARPVEQSKKGRTHDRSSRSARDSAVTASGSGVGFLFGAAGRSTSRATRPLPEMEEIGDALEVPPSCRSGDGSRLGEGHMNPERAAEACGAQASDVLPIQGQPPSTRMFIAAQLPARIRATPSSDSSRAGAGSAVRLLAPGETISLPDGR